MTTVIPTVERSIDDALLWILLDQPEGVRVHLFRELNGAAIYDPEENRASVIEVFPCPKTLRAGEQYMRRLGRSHEEAFAALQLPGESAREDEDGYDDGDLTFFDYYPAAER
jgi:hypothetical protein